MAFKIAAAAPYPFRSISLSNMIARLSPMLLNSFFFSVHNVFKEEGGYTVNIQLTSNDSSKAFARNGLEKALNRISLASWLLFFIVPFPNLICSTIQQIP